jgi:hypothetical protein
MLRLTVISLLLGALALTAGLKLMLWEKTRHTEQAAPILWNPDTASSAISSGEFVEERFRLTMAKSPYGGGVQDINLDTKPFEASAYSFLHLSLDGLTGDTMVMLYWSTDGDEQQKHKYILENKLRKSIWIATSELPGWAGTITKIGLVIMAPQARTFYVNDLSLHPASLLRQLQAIYTDWTAFTPWKKMSVATNPGVMKVSSFYPVPLTAALLALSLLAYISVLLITGDLYKLDWQVVSMICLACWLALDIAWQNQLLQRLDETHRKFAGMDTDSKLAVGPDAELYQFIAAAKQHIESPDARVIVASSDLYLGMRGAYYLYPYNVFWSLEPPEIPANEYLRSGDYIVLIQPTKAYFSKNKGQIKAPENRPHNAERLLHTRSGSLVRLK